MPETQPHAVPSLTYSQRAALAQIATGPRSSWDYGSTTVHRLRTEGYVEGKTTLTITAKGRAAL